MNDTLKIIGPQIAANLTGWMFTFVDCNAQLVPIGKNWVRGGKAIHLQVDHKKRIHVHGAWPYTKSNGCKTPSDLYVDGKRQESPRITVALDKDPAKIAADIQRRFLATYLDLYAKCVEKIAQEGAGEARQLRVSKEFAKTVGTTTENSAVHFYGERCYGHVNTNWNGDTGTMELRGDVAILKAALEAAVKAGLKAK